MSREDIQHRFAFHPATSERLRDMHDGTRYEVRKLAHWLDDVLPDGREKGLAMMNLEQVMFWANAAIARSGEVE